jgi:VWFA-related protein
MGWMLAGFVCIAAGQHKEHGRAQPSSHLVDLNMVALDSSGEPVRDLKGEEIEVFDNGKRQALAYFRHLESGPRRRAPLGANQYSNRSGGNLGHPVVILFDQLNQVMGDRGYTANAIVHSLEPMETSESLYLYLLTIDGQLYPVHALPAGARPAPAVPWTRDIRPLLDNALRAVLRTRPVDIDIFARIDLTYKALAAMAMRMEAIPGRKNLVWLSHGVPISLTGARTYDGMPVDFTPMLRGLSDALDRSHVAIYPVQLSAPGMDPTSMTQAVAGSGPSRLGGAGGGPGGLGLGSGNDNPAGVNQGSGVGSEDTMQEFAGLTGGRSKGNNDIGEAIRQAIADARSSYQLGYDTQPQPWEGKYHKLRLASTRKGVRLQTKTGYYAWPPPAPEQAEQQAFQAMAAAQTDAADIGLTAELMPPAAGAKTVRVRLTIDGHDVLFSQEGQQYSVYLGVGMAAYLSDGRGTGLPSGVLSPALNAQQYQDALKDGLSTVVEAPLAEGLEKVRVMVYDRGDHQIGSVTVPLAK